ncbi:ubiquinone anaerobic biosynthesis protein UbiU [Peristeroidobacter agariperforans]|uniref:ubiquinone anaerobic biosynthesis protein UbiU n=1 Tax=Peristeroidobacter agariperforans TaxID=268404 RepID=UPI00101DA096|nr:peptidase U32 family protein [Peristeroidobacter agariperforans]
MQVEPSSRVELVCPAGSLPALRAAVDHGADAVYIGFRGETNARNFPGLNFSIDDAATGIEHAHLSGARVFIALNVYPMPKSWAAATAAVDAAVTVGADALILADPGLMKYAREHHPRLRLHLSVQGSATNWRAIEFYRRQFGIQRAVLPRVLSATQVERLIGRTPVEIEIFGFGSLCVMVEGRCALSSYATGHSPNMQGVCSPAQAVRWEETPEGRQSRLNGVLIDRYAPGEAAGYPTLCKGRFRVNDDVFHALEEPTALNALDVLPRLIAAGIRAVKVEGRQRSPAYVAQVTRVMRRALDHCLDGTSAAVPPTVTDALDHLAEGRTHTLGAYHRPWQ